MLKTNSKAVRQKIRGYIVANSLDCLIDDYNVPSSELSSFSEIAKKILEIWTKETRYDYMVRKNGYTYGVFKSWGQGLPIGDLFLYYYSINAVNLVRDILEETEAEASKFTDQQAEELLTKLIYRELRAGTKK